MTPPCVAVFTLRAPTHKGTLSELNRAWFFSVLLTLCACGGATEKGDVSAEAGAGSSNAATGGQAAAGADSVADAGRAAGGSNSPAAGGASNGSAGRGGAGNSAGAGGKAAAAGGAGRGGAPASSEPGPSATCKAWPAATGSLQKLTQTVSVSKAYDGKLQRFVSDGLGDGKQGEDQLPLFELADGATLENVIIGAPAADGIHCAGTCTLKNVWWEDVGEDAATFKGVSTSQVMTVDCGGAKLASDKVFQHNGAGTLKVSNFFIATFGKLYRSCGNCSKQYPRHVVLSGIRAEGGSVLVGVNANYNDSATFSNIQTSSSTTICERYTGNDTGAEPPKVGSGADGKVCIYASSDIHGL